MDNQLAAQFKELETRIKHDVDHQLEDALASSTHLHRVIGESMNHIGKILELTSARYLPIRPEEILVKPEVLVEGSREAVLLIRRTLIGPNTFKVLAKVSKADEQGKRAITVTAFSEDPQNLAATRFVTPPQLVADEIVRQLGIYVPNEGVVLLQVVVAPEYFPAVVDKPEPHVTTVQELFDAVGGDAAAELETTQAPVQKPVEEPGLPAVSTDYLL